MVTALLGAAPVLRSDPWRSFLRTRAETWYEEWGQITDAPRA
jgi:hypothetical protein